MPIKEYKHKINSGGKRKIIYLIAGVLLSLILVIIPTYLIINIVRRPCRKLAFYEFTVPQKIQIYKREAEKSEAKKILNNGNNSTAYEKSFFTVTIEDALDIRRIASELNFAKTKSLNFLEKLNYEKMRLDNYPYYILKLDTLRLDNKKITRENKYNTYLVITSNKTAVLENIIYEDTWFFKNMSMHEIYPIDFSKETMDMIFKYIEQYEIKQ
jgi:hypothetical protein